MTPTQIILSFINALNRRDFGAVMALVADDIVYDNMPLETLRGAAQFEEFLSPWTALNDEISIVVNNIVAVGDLVVVERTDRDRKGSDDWVETMAAGFYVVRDGKIAEWRDYFDMNSFCLQNGADYHDIVERARAIAGH